MWIRYYRDGRRYEESSHSEKHGDAERLLKIREGDVAKGLPVTSKIGRLRFDEAINDAINDYKINGKRSLDEVERRIDKHLKPYFGNRRMGMITTSDVRAYIAKRQTDTIIVRKGRTVERPDGAVCEIPEETKLVSVGEINRELTILKRAFNLAIQAAKLLHKPHIPMLREDNARTGFFDAEQIGAVLAHLPDPLRPAIRFAYITGWRIPSEVLPLEWRQVDLTAGEVRLDPGQTKNREGRVFPLTVELRALLEERQQVTKAIERQRGQIIPWVFFRMVAKGGGEKYPKVISTLGGAWKAACRAAGCPGRIPHDLRRSAVRNMVRAGVPERVAMKLSGHKTRSVFDRYNIVSEGDLLTAAQKLNDAPAASDRVGRVVVGTITGTVDRSGRAR